MTVFISDLHLFSAQARNLKVLDEFLHTRDPGEVIYLVGDIIDDHRLMAIPYDHLNLLNTLLHRFQRVYYLAGNHDRWINAFPPFVIHNIVILTETQFNVGHKSYLVTHGDAYDWALKYAFGLSSRHVGHAIRNIASRVHGWLTGTSDAIIEYTKVREYDGVICGHTHEPMIARIDGIEYMNCGDWVQNFTVLIEENGEFRLDYLVNG